MAEPIDLIAQWTAEYEKGGIPSSIRETPSGAVVWAVDELKRLQFPLREAVDVGCGKGRNSLYLARQGAHVTAMDFTPNAIRHLQDTAQREGLDGKIRAIAHDVTEAWPIAAGNADLVVDAFCFKHIAPHEARICYKENLLRILRTRGHYLISFASIGDGYYGRYIVQTPEAGGGESQVVVDPANGIESVLFSRKHVLDFFQPELSLQTEIHRTKPSAMHGTVYERSTYAMLLQHNPRRAF